MQNRPDCVQQHRLHRDLRFDQQLLHQRQQLRMVSDHRLATPVQHPVRGTLIQRFGQEVFLQFAIVQDRQQQRQIMARFQPSASDLLNGREDDFRSQLAAECVAIVACKHTDHFTAIF